MYEKNYSKDKVYAMILQDESMSREWEHANNSSSFSDSDLHQSKFISENDLSQMLKDILDHSGEYDKLEDPHHDKSKDYAFYKEKTFELIQINYSYRNTICKIK